MKNNPLVSYIIPSYNHAQYIEQAIDSVLNQNYEPIELIVVDDGSKDNTAEVVEKYQNNPRVTIILNQKNSGQSVVVNQALKIAKGVYVGMLPSDDWLLPDKTQLQVNKFGSVGEEVGIVYGKGARFFEYEDGRSEIIETNYDMQRGKITADLVMQGNFIYPITPLFRKECFERYPFDESYTAEGEAIYLKLSLSYQFDFVEEVVGVMRDHLDNTGKKTDLMYEENLRYLNDFFAREDLPEEVRSLKNKRLATLHKIKAMEMVLLKQNYGKGRSLALKALSLYPGYIMNAKFILALILTYLPKSLLDYLLSRFYRQAKDY